MDHFEGIEALYEEFPELRQPDVVHRKEMLAHFGLVFSAFADLEASIQMVFIHTELWKALQAREVTSEEEWTRAFDDLQAKAQRATLGTLLKLVSAYQDLESLKQELLELKGRRDHFAHHFFREELPSFFSDGALLHVLLEMQTLRRRTEDATSQVNKRYDIMLSRMCPRTDFKARISDVSKQIEQEFKSATSATISWENDS